jgi:hypothetical protein
MTEQEHQIFLEKLNLYINTQDKSELLDFFKNNPHLYEDEKFLQLKEGLSDFLLNHAEKGIKDCSSLEDMIQAIFEYPILNDSYDDDDEQIQKAYQLFRENSSSFNLETELTHELISRLVATTKLRIMTDTGNPFRGIPEQMAQEVNTALGILSFIITQPYFKDLTIDNIRNIDPFYSHFELDEEIGEYYASSHQEGLLKLQSNTYFSHLCELFSLYTTYNRGESKTVSHEFYCESIQFLFDYLSHVKVEKSIIEEFKNSPHFIPRLKSILAEQIVYYHNSESNPIHEVLKKTELLESGFEKFLMEHTISENTKQHLKMKI